MSKDYKQNTERQSRSKKGSPFLTGLLIGILLGIAASLAVVVYLKRDDNPFAIQTNKQAGKSLSDKIAEDAKSQEKNTTASTNNAPEAGATGDETSYDFYTILPSDTNKIGKEVESALKTNDQPAIKKTYYLQVGSFHTEEEADNLKAKLALQGFEAVVQTADIPEKGVWHRVRVGPLNDLDQITKTKTELLNNGFNADLIKINSES